MSMIGRMQCISEDLQGFGVDLTQRPTRSEDEAYFLLQHLRLSSGLIPLLAITGNSTNPDGRDLRDPNHISTSYVERQNLTMRMSMRRFTRLTNAFSKKIENLRHAVALNYMHYNFCRVHQTLSPSGNETQSAGWSLPADSRAGSSSLRSSGCRSAVCHRNSQTLTHGPPGRPAG